MVPQAQWDAWAMSQFPGRTLDELKDIDVLRVLRAQQVQRIERIEQLRQIGSAGKSLNSLSPADWRAIARHDKLVNDR